ncbi:RagB/SusD family nutrient uptake outer membrane protein [Sphingobacterium sp. Mn56C]|uniref:RagB/SusD family nutrient uptake outer membrane protein n=1 Tax=Sphingobacterium sp. Mn56C TaxID=3395261 RepID=UPI003BBB73AD
MLSTLYRLFFCLLLTLSLGSCTNFLDESDRSNFTVENYFTKPEHALGITNATYDALKTTTGGGFGGAPWMMLEFATGLADTELGQAMNSIFVKDLINNSDNSYGNSYWVSSYRGIANANLAIQKIPEIEMDELLKARYLGEVHFLRAYYYFNLVRIFGKVPLLTKSIDLNSSEMYPQQAELKDIYTRIEQDLLFAENAGLPITDLTGRVSLLATKTLLANVYLTMAGYPLQGGKEYYEKAFHKSKEVIESKKSKLFSSYMDLHNPAKKNIDEHIFMVQFSANHQPAGWQTSIIPYNGGISVYADQTGAIFANRDFVESYAKNDLRRAEKQFYYKEYTLASNRNNSKDLGNYYIYKLFDVEAQERTARSHMNWPLLRYADVLLTFAEAGNEVFGPTTDIYDAVNLLRKRAELPDLQGLSKEELRIAILQERWYELSFENKTWFDMARLRLAFNVKTKKFENFVGHTFSYGPRLTERELLFPIPTAEIRNNTNLKQNNGY